MDGGTSIAPSHRSSCSAPVGILLLAQSASFAVAEKTLAPGTSFVFELTGNPSTGFVWRLNEAASENAGIVKVDDLGYGEAEGKGGKKLLGAPASYRLRITGLTSGSARLRFEYVRPWVGTPTKTKDLRVRIE